MNIKYLCNVPENDQAHLIFDEVVINNLELSFNGQSTILWHVAITVKGKPVLKNITPLRSFSECLAFLAEVVPCNL